MSTNEFDFETLVYDYTADLMGQYEVLMEDYTVGGYNCADMEGIISEEAAVWRPDAEGTFPVITWAHGYGQGDEEIHGNDSMLMNLASAGYVVIGNKSSGYDGMCQETADQIRSLEWAKDETSEIYPFVDWSKPSGFAGYSMGGWATLDSAANAEAIATYNVAAAFANHPMSNVEAISMCEEWFMCYEIDIPIIPTFVATGSMEEIMSPEGVKADFDRIDLEGSAKGSVFANLVGANHYEPMMPESAWTPYQVYFFNCWIKEQQDDCDLIYGVDNDDSVISLCNSPDIELLECFTGAQ